MKYLIIPMLLVVTVAGFVYGYHRGFSTVSKQLKEEVPHCPSTRVLAEKQRLLKYYKKETEEVEAKLYDYKNTLDECLKDCSNNKHNEATK